MKPALTVVSRRSIGPKQVSVPMPWPTGSTSSIVELPMPLSLSLYTGDSFAMTLTITNPDGTPTNLVGATVAAQIRTNPASSAISGAFRIGIQSNVITLELLGSDTANLVGNFSWDCQLINASGWVQTLVYGPISFTQDVTRS